MNSIVGELVALVGGTSAHTGPAERGTHRRKLSQADHLYHHIASATESKKGQAGQDQKTRRGAKEAIPLDDEQLEHFNS